MNRPALIAAVVLCGLVCGSWAQPAVTEAGDAESSTSVGEFNAGEKRAYLLQLFDGFWGPNYGPASDIASRTEAVEVPEDAPPGIKKALQLLKNESFSLFIPRHKEMAYHLVTAFLAFPTLDAFLEAAEYCHDAMHAELYVYALSVAMLNRNDTRSVPPPPLVGVQPYKFIPPSGMAKLNGGGGGVQKRSTTCNVVIPLEYSETDPREEDRLSYFREDIGLSLHHWSWHLLYPFSGPRTVVDKDRRGEMFYYLHQQILARYNFERFSCRLPRVVPISSLHGTLPEGYDPELNDTVTEVVYSPRADNTVFQDIDRPREQLQVRLQTTDVWNNRISQAISAGTYQNNQGQSSALTEDGGIDVVGNMVEASILSPSTRYYGNLHNTGHVIIAFMHDPDGVKDESFGVMADTATAMRDPVFYRWHGKVNGVFQEHKDQLPGYSVEQLSFGKVSVTSVSVVSDGDPDNELFTFFETSEIDLSSGIDFTTSGPDTVCFSHLQHRDFEYRIAVDNLEGQEVMGLVRVFLAPQYKEQGLPIPFEEQRHLFAEMDKFPVLLRSGVNVISRLSTQSSVTIPFDRTFRRLELDQLSGDELDEYVYCGCGWPHHLLVPKGRPEGLAAQLFVMVSNYSQDSVDDLPKQGCSDGASYCGLRGQLYPDRRAMGYPFDRKPSGQVPMLTEFLTPNMKTQDVVIRFSDEVVESPADAA